MLSGGDGERVGGGNGERRGLGVPEAESLTRYISRSPSGCWLTV